jgi:hypothetical protein
MAPIPASINRDRFRTVGRRFAVSPKTGEEMPLTEMQQFDS